MCYVCFGKSKCLQWNTWLKLFSKARWREKSRNFYHRTNESFIFWWFSRKTFANKTRLSHQAFPCFLYKNRILEIRHLTNKNVLTSSFSWLNNTEHFSFTNRFHFWNGNIPFALNRIQTYVLQLNILFKEDPYRLFFSFLFDGIGQNLRPTLFLTIK